MFDDWLATIVPNFKAKGCGGNHGNGKEEDKKNKDVGS